MNTAQKVTGLYKRPKHESIVIASQWLPVIDIAAPLGLERSHTIKLEIFYANRDGKATYPATMMFIKNMNDCNRLYQRGNCGNISSNALTLSISILI